MKDTPALLLALAIFGFAAFAQPAPATMPSAAPPAATLPSWNDSPSKLAFALDRLDEAASRGWVVVDMKRDWARIF